MNIKWGLVSLVVLLAAGPASGALNNPGKVGIGTWDKDSVATALKDVENMRFGWHYDWSTTQLWAPSGTARTVPFVPMVWNQQMIGNALPASDVLLGFNEPDNCSQGGVCMSVASAISYWPQLQTMATAGRRIGSPAAANDATKGWLADFMAQAASRGYRVDFITVHYYSPLKGSLGVAAFKSHLEAVYAKYNKPIWVTEWALVDWSKTQPSQTLAESAAYASEALAMLDSLPFVEKHAYFSSYYYQYGAGGLNTELYASNGSLTAVGQVFYNALHASAPADTTAPAVSLSAPTAGATVSGSAVTVSANASDNVGVAGVQFKLDGVNLGAEDTAAPFSVAWNTTLASNAAHTLTAVARDGAGNTATSAAIGVTVNNAAAAPSVSGVAASGITLSAATVGWTSNVPTYSQIEYGTSISYGLWGTFSGSLLTSHSSALSGLAAGTLYHFRIKSWDAANNVGLSGDYTFTTAATSDTAAPIISGVSASNLTAGAATILWTTNEASNSQVEYGLSASYGLASALNGALATSHSMGLSGLSASTLYHYRVKSRDSAGNLAVSGDLTFTTGAAAPAGTSFSDTFNSGAPTGWTPVSGTWSVSSGRYTQGSLALYRALTVAGSTWRDISVQADVNIVSGGQDLNQIILRYIDANNYVAAYISKYWGCIGLEQMQGGARTYSQVTFAPAYNTWYTLKAVATGGQAQVYLNGALKHTWTLPNGTTQGRIGLGNSVSTALFDNVAAGGAAGATDLTAPASAIKSPSQGATVPLDIRVTAAGSDNVGVTRVELWGDGTLRSAQNFAPAVLSFTTTLAWRANKGQRKLQVFTYDAAGNKGSSALVTVTASRSVSLVSLVSSENGGRASEEEPRALMLSAQQSRGASLAFSEDVQDAAVIDLRGRSILQQSKQAGPIVMRLQGSSGGRLTMEAGLWLIQMRDGSGQRTVKPLVVVK